MKSFIKELIAFFHEYRYIILIALLTSIFGWFILQSSLFIVNRIIENDKNVFFSKIDSIFKGHKIIAYKIDDELDEYYTIVLDSTEYDKINLFKTPKNKVSFSAEVYHALILKEKGYVVNALLAPRGIIYYKSKHLTIDDHLTKARKILNNSVIICDKPNELEPNNSMFLIRTKYYSWACSDFDAIITENTVLERIHMAANIDEFPHFIYEMVPLNGYCSVQDEKASDKLRNIALMVSFLCYLSFLIILFLLIKKRPGRKIFDRIKNKVGIT